MVAHRSSELAARCGELAASRYLFDSGPRMIYLGLRPIWHKKQVLKAVSRPQKRLNRHSWAWAARTRATAAGTSAQAGRPGA